MSISDFNYGELCCPLCNSKNIGLVLGDCGSKEFCNDCKTNSDDWSDEFKKQCENSIEYGFDKDEGVADD